MVACNPRSEPSHDDRRLRMLFFLDYEDEVGGRFYNSPGLLPLIEHTRRQGFDVNLVIRRGELFRALESPEVDAVGISSMERMLPRTLPLAREVRARRPDLPLMLGGNSIESFAVDLVAGLFDIVVLGEAEHLLPALLRALGRARGRRLPGAPGPPSAVLPSQVHRLALADPDGALTEREVAELLAATFPRRLDGEDWVAVGVGNTLVRDPNTRTVWRLDAPTAPLELPGLDTDPAPLQAELDEICSIPWDEVERKGWKHMELYAQRGCRWGHCHFCSVNREKLRWVSPGRVIEVIEEAAAHGVDVVSFADNFFAQFPDWCGDVLDRLVERRLPITLLAQTMAIRTVWPLLGKMRAAGFTELSFGVETLNAERAELLGKTNNGRAYVRQVRETILRTADAGLFPVLFLIMADPTSTLAAIARETRSLLELMDEVYRRTRVLPKPSHSLALLPVAGTRLTARFPHHDEPERVGSRVVDLPSMFRFSPSVSEFFNRIGEATSALPSPRENLKAFELYFRTAFEVARDLARPEVAAIEEDAGRGMETLDDLMLELDRDADASASALAEAFSRHCEEIDPSIIDFRRFGGYLAGVERLGRGLEAVVARQRELA